MNISQENLKQIATDLELDEIKSVKFLYSKKIGITLKFVEMLKLVEKDKGEREFFVWKTSTKKGELSLVSTNLTFFQNKEFMNPFTDSDNFYLFREEIRNELGLSEETPYESEAGFYLSVVSAENQKMSFFAYKA